LVGETASELIADRSFRRRRKTAAAATAASTATHRTTNDMRRCTSRNNARS